MNHPQGDQPVTLRKHTVRQGLLTARAGVTAAVRAEESALLRGHAPTLAAAFPEAFAGGGAVAAFVPVGDEPGSPDLPADLARLGARVLLPVTGPRGAALRWGVFTRVEDLAGGRFGLREPTGPTRGPEALAEAALVLLPALAVDGRGARLGRGAGFYDRSLAAVPVAAPLVALVRDGEVLDEVPEEPHDRRVGWVLTPRGGLRRLGAAPDQGR